MSKNHQTFEELMNQPLDAARRIWKRSRKKPSPEQIEEFKRKMKMLFDNRKNQDILPMLKEDR